MKTAVAIFACTILALAAQCVAKDCYSCNYAKKGNDVYENFLIEYKKDCGDPFKKSNITTESCSNSCYKAEVDVPEKNLQCISRGCFPSKKCAADGQGQEFVLECDGKAYETTLNCCNGHKCNGAVAHYLSAVMLTAALITVGYVL